MTLIQLLIENKDDYTSGEFLSEKLGISRAAIWKQIKTLQTKGVEIESSQSLGYKLISTQNYIDKKYLQSLLPNLNIEVFDTIASTNDYAKTITSKPSLIIAKEQTQGKGRRGKSFYSPQNHGTYFSYIPNTTYKTSDLSLITIRSALALNKSIQYVFHVDTKIKWLNDIYLDDYKLAGILVEGSIELQTLTFDQIIIGIGLNLNQAEIPENINHIYTHLNLNHYDLHMFYQHFIMTFNQLHEATLIDEYRKQSMIFGRDVIHSEDGQTYKAIDIDETGALIIESKEGVRTHLQHGEVSLKIK